MTPAFLTALRDYIDTRAGDPITAANANALWATVEQASGIPLCVHGKVDGCASCHPAGLPPFTPSGADTSASTTAGK